MRMDSTSGFGIYLIICLNFLSAVLAKGGPRVAPYVDITLPGQPSLKELASMTGQRDYTLAFLLGNAEGCRPSWGGTIPLSDPSIINQIRELQSIGGQVIAATGGAIGPYLETACHSEESLTDVYEQILDALKTDHLDIDIEASVNLNRVTKALAAVQKKRPNTTVSFTVMVQGDDYGIVPSLGVQLLKAAKRNSLRVDLVNPMTMEFGSNRESWGDAVIAAATATLRQMKAIWPKYSVKKRKRMLGVTPMIGRNFNRKVFEPKHAKQLVEWAKEHNIGLLAFWSVGRDNGDCPGGGAPSAKCSSIAQDKYEFTKIFTEYNKYAVELTEEEENEVEDGGEEEETVCRAVSEPARFDVWCKSNCAVGHCPGNLCTCEAGGRKVEFRTESNEISNSKTKALNGSRTDKENAGWTLRPNSALFIISIICLLTNARLG